MQNMRANEQAKNEMFNAWDAVERFRRNGDCRRFPDLRRYLSGRTHQPFPHDAIFKISGWGILDERVTREEYDRMKAAWRQTEADKASTYNYPWETPDNSTPAKPAEPNE
jgi:hypothetical protein